MSDGKQARRVSDQEIHEFHSDFLQLKNEFCIFKEQYNGRMDKEDANFKLLFNGQKSLIDSVKLLTEETKASREWWADMQGTFRMGLRLKRAVGWLVGVPIVGGGFAWLFEKLFGG